MSLAVEQTGHLDATATALARSCRSGLVFVTFRTTVGRTRLDNFLVNQLAVSLLETSEGDARIVLRRPRFARL